MIRILDDDKGSVFCTNCNRTVKEGVNGLKVSTPHCYHLINPKTRSIATITTEYEKAEPMKVLLEGITPHMYSIERCDGKRIT